MNKINPYYIVKTAFTKQADTISMQFEPSSTPTWSLDNLADKDPTVQKTPWQATQQHPAIPDMNQRYSSRPYGSASEGVLDYMLGNNKRGYTPMLADDEENAKLFLTVNRNYDLLRFLLSQGHPTTQAPYLQHMITQPVGWQDSQVRLDNTWDRTKPSNVDTFLFSPPLSGHELEHVIDLNKQLDYNPYFKPTTYSRPSSLEVLRRETAATLGHYTAMQKALKDRPDLWERYVKLSAPTLMPSLGTYYSLAAPNALKELGEAGGGTTKVLTGLTNPKNWSSKNMKKRFRQGAASAHKLFGKPFPGYAMPIDQLKPWQLQLNKQLFETVRDKHRDENLLQQNLELMDEMRDYAKKKYGYENSRPWYNPNLSATQNLGFGAPLDYQRQYYNPDFDIKPEDSPLLDEINNPQYELPWKQQLDK